MGIRSKAVRKLRTIGHWLGIAGAKRRYLGRIDRLEPAVTDAQSPAAVCELHMMTYDRDWSMALWAARSFYHFAGVRWPIVFHIGGAISQKGLWALRRHFPQAVIWTMAEADARVEPRLEQMGLTHLIGARRACVLMRKMIDFGFLAQSPNIAGLDTDILFFRRPDEVIDAGQGPAGAPLFIRDCVSTYSLSPQEARERFGIELVERLNTGLSVWSPSILDLQQANRCFADGMLLRARWLAEQTAQALLASAHGVRFLPDTYVTSVARGLRSPLGEDLVAKHYPNAPRPLYFTEGLRVLSQGPWLSAVGAKNNPRWL